MSEFYKYRSKRRKFNNLELVVGQEIVRQKYPKITFRLPMELKKKIDCRSKEIDMNPSEMTRLLWEDYFRKKESFEWQKETSEWS